MNVPLLLTDFPRSDADLLDIVLRSRALQRRIEVAREREPRILHEETGQEVNSNDGAPDSACSPGRRTGGCDT